MKSKIKGIAYVCISIVFWITMWQILALSLDLSFVFPRFDDTLKTFLSLVITSEFWKTILTSMCRILLGFVIGTFLGILLAVITNHSLLLRTIISPAMTVIKSTPVASFILVLWCLIGKNSVPSVIAVLMVMPIVWQNLLDGYSSISGELTELCDVFEVGTIKRFKILTFPALRRYLAPAMITASSLAWKSGIAAEIIVYAKNSIGKEITDAKNFFESETMFAWTIAVILLSIVIEILIRKMSRMVKKI